MNARIKSKKSPQVVYTLSFFKGIQPTSKFAWKSAGSKIWKCRPISGWHKFGAETTILGLIGALEIIFYNKKKAISVHDSLSSYSPISFGSSIPIITELFRAEGVGAVWSFATSRGVHLPTGNSWPYEGTIKGWWWLTTPLIRSCFQGRVALGGMPLDMDVRYMCILCPYLCTLCICIPTGC